MKENLKYKLVTSTTGEKFIYIPENGKFFHTDEAGLDIIDAMSSQKSDSEIIASLMAKGANKEAASAMIANIRKADIFKPKEMPESGANPSMLVLMVAQACNMRCRYCFAEGGTYHNSGLMSYEVATKAVDHLVKHADKADLTVCFFGGEPLLQFELIKQVVAYCHEIEAAGDKHFHFTTTTNGTLINTDIEEFFRKEHFSVQVSLDGDRVQNDKNRIFADGSGTYDAVLDRTRGLRRGTPGLKTHATISMDNVDMVNAFEHLSAEGFREVQIVPAHSEFLKEQYPVLEKEMDRLLEKLKALINQGDYKEALKMKMQMKGLKMVHFGQVRNRVCGAGTAMIVVDHEGKIYPCHRLTTYGETFCEGDIYNTDAAANSLLAEVTDACFDCWCRGLCAGGCPASNYAKTGDAKKPPEEYCNYQRHYYTKLLEIYADLTADDKQRLFHSMHIKQQTDQPDPGC